MLLPSEAWWANCFSLSGNSLFLAEPVKWSVRTVSSASRVFPVTKKQHNITTQHPTTLWSKVMLSCLQRCFMMKQQQQCEQESYSGVGTLSFCEIFVCLQLYLLYSLVSSVSASSLWLWFNNQLFLAVFITMQIVLHAYQCWYCCFS